MEEFGAVTRDGKLILDPICRRRLDVWTTRQAEGARWRVRISRESPPRENSQNRGHWERCGILGAELGLSKEAVSDILMEYAFEATQNPVYGERRQVFGSWRFIPGSTRDLTKSEFWELKRQAYERLAFINEDKDPNHWTLFPERGEGGLILRMCARWDERPEDIRE